MKDFVEFIRSLWAILATTSLFFPFAGTFLDVIPTTPFGGDTSFPFYNFPPEIIPALASLFCAFNILLIFNRREHLKDPTIQPEFMKRSVVSFAWGIVGLLGYFSLRHVDVGSFTPAIDPSRLLNLKPIMKFIVDIVMLCCYCLFFGMITRAFMFQAIITYHGRSER